MTRRLALILALGIAVAGLYFAGRYTSRSRLSLSDKPNAPSFTLTDLDGNKVDLASYRGEVVLLNFWATWCEPCRKEIPRFIEFQNSYGNHGLQVLGISLDDEVAPVKKFRDEFKVNYPIAMGDARLAESYGGVLGLPISFVIDPEGRIHAKHIGAVDPTVIEHEIQKLLQAQPTSSAR